MATLVTGAPAMWAGRWRERCWRGGSGCDTLHHAAALYDFWVPDKRLLMETEVAGTRNALAGARAAGAQKVVYISTFLTIGEAPGGTADESTPHRGYFVTACEEAKYRAEQVALEFARDGLPVAL